jgi:hypothetical protein
MEAGHTGTVIKALSWESVVYREEEEMFCILASRN